MEWDRLLSAERRKPSKSPGTGRPESRTEHERDHDRILFSTPVRRLADKTQVFPLDRNDSVRTRLTHSHEVSNLCRGMGTRLVFDRKVCDGSDRFARSIPSILSATGLAHDLGNPPFGHQGEGAIQAWFKARSKFVLDDPGLVLTEAQKLDFLNFEGNAQTFRILTRLQLLNDDFGLDLTYSTLAAVMKYPAPADARDKSLIARKKHGYFQSEASIVAEVWEKTGLAEGVRHPLTFLMEACDDIAYTVLDAEDAVKKGLVSFSDLIAYLGHHGAGDSLIQEVVKRAEDKHDEFRAQPLSPAELNDVSMQMFRVYAISAMVDAAMTAFYRDASLLQSERVASDLLGVSIAARLRDCLKKFDTDHAYRHRSVLAVEATGVKTIGALMDVLWRAITEREHAEVLGSKRSTPFLRYVYERISENYRRVFESPNNSMPIRYREAQLLTDMISGMTDSFAIDLLADFRRYDDRLGN